MEFSTFLLLSTLLICYGMVFLVAVSTEKEAGHPFWKELIEAVQLREKWPLILLGIAFFIGLIISVVLGAILNYYGRTIVFLAEILAFLWSWNIVVYDGREMFSLIFSPDGTLLHTEGLSEKQIKCIRKKSKEIVSVFSFCCEENTNGKKLILQAKCNKYVPFCLAGGILEAYCENSNGHKPACFPEREKRKQLLKLFKECGIKVAKIA